MVFMLATGPVWRQALWAIVAPFGLYAAFLGLSSIPFIQRHFVYAHRINTLWWTNVNEPEKWGFAKNQVTPFTLESADGHSLYAWHILPLPVYLQNEDNLIEQPTGLCKDFSATENFRILKDDPKSRLVLYFHGNAGHVAQGWRPGSYHVLTDTSAYHVVAIDYRGYGHSTGSPTEEGLILDASAAVEWATQVAGVPASRIVLMGQSLGTAITAAVAERYARRGVEFAGVVLIAGFSSLPTMLAGYSIGGFVPVLAPLRLCPPALRLVMSFVVDRWQSADRLARLVRATRTRLRLSLVHARNDRDIPCVESSKLFRAAAMATLEGELDDHAFQSWKDVRTVVRGKDAFRTTWTAEPDIVIRQEQFAYGGHNDIMSYAPVTLAILRSFDLEGTPYS